MLLAGLLGLAAPGQAGPGSPDKPVKWEYAELTYRHYAGHRGGVTAAGTFFPDQPDTEVIRWVTAEGEVEAKGWADLAERLKAPAFKKEGSAAYQRVQVFNHLGRDGWELVEQTEATTPPPIGAPPKAWTFKRRVP